jgi:hypothetical protein
LKRTFFCVTSPLSTAKMVSDLSSFPGACVMGVDGSHKPVLVTIVLVFMSRRPIWESIVRTWSLDVEATNASVTPALTRLIYRKHKSITLLSPITPPPLSYFASLFILRFTFRPSFFDVPPTFQ